MPKIVEHIKYEEYLDLKKNSTKLINKRTALRRLLRLLEQEPFLINYFHSQPELTSQSQEDIQQIQQQLQNELQRLDDEFKVQQKELQKQFSRIR